jgi:archaellum biogenesis ATPase FlaH
MRERAVIRKLIKEQKQHKKILKEILKAIEYIQKVDTFQTGMILTHQKTVEEILTRLRLLIAIHNNSLNN